MGFFDFTTKWRVFFCSEIAAQEETETLLKLSLSLRGGKAGLKAPLHFNAKSVLLLLSGILFTETGDDFQPSYFVMTILVQWIPSKNMLFRKKDLMSVSFKFSCFSVAHLMEKYFHLHCVLLHVFSCCQ